MSFFSGAGGGAIGAAAGLIGSGITAASQKRQQKRQFEYNEKAADNAHKRGKDMFDYQSAYNSPAEQRRRLEEAGFSAGAMMSGLGGQGGQGSASAGAMGAGVGMTQGFDATGAMNSAMQGAQLQLMRQEIEGKKLENEGKGKDNLFKDLEYTSMLLTIDNEKIKGEGMKVDNLIKQLDVSFRQSADKLSLDKLSAEIENTRKSTDKLISDIESSDIDNVVKQENIKIAKEQLNENLRNGAIQRMAISANIELTKAQAGKIDEEIKKWGRDETFRAMEHGDKQKWLQKELELNWEKFGLDKDKFTKECIKDTADTLIKVLDAIIPG